MRGVSTILVEHSTLFREGLGKLLANTGFIVTAMVSCAEDIECENLPEPQLVIIGARYNDRDFDRNIKLLRERFHESRFVVLADQYDPDQVHTAFRLSACGYMMKNVNFSTLIKSLELVMLGESIFPSAILTHRAEERGLDLDPDEEIVTVTPPTTSLPCTLSNRETEILQCLVRGQSNKVIARNLNIVEATVKVHIKAILRKIRVQNRTQAAIWAVNRLDPMPAIVDAGATAYRANGAHPAP